MKGRTLYKKGALSVIVATGLFVASNGFAASEDTTQKLAGNMGMGVQSHDSSGDPQNRQTVSSDLTTYETSKSQLFEVFPPANYYYSAPPKSKDGDPVGENLTPYFWNMSH